MEYKNLINLWSMEYKKSQTGIISPRVVLENPKTYRILSFLKRQGLGPRDIGSDTQGLDVLRHEVFKSLRLSSLRT
jgi:hypothetical protein